MILQTCIETMNILSKASLPVPIFLLLLSLCALCSAQDKRKIEYGVLLDNTGSMRSQFNMVKEIGKAVAQQIHDHGPVSLFDFASAGHVRGAGAVPTPRIEQTQDEQLLEQAIEDLYIEGGQTTLLDAVQFIAERLSQQARGSDFSDRVIILITDGEDRNSLVGQKRLIEKLVEMKIRVYAIGLVQQLDSADGYVRKSPRSRAIDLLKEITKETGGRVVFPKSSHEDMKRFVADLAIVVQ